MGDSDLNQSCDSATILRAQTPVQIGSILVNIGIFLCLFPNFFLFAYI